MSDGRATSARFRKKLSGFGALLLEAVEARMGKRVLAVDAFNVIDIFRKWGLSFEEIAALGFHLEDEPERKLTAGLISVWYEEEKLERAPAINIIGGGKEPKA